MSGRYSPVESDIEEEEVPVRHFRLRSNGVAKPLPTPGTPSPSRSSAHDNLDRAMHEFQSMDRTPTRARPLPSHTRQSSSIASPTPQRHDSVSSSSTHSRPQSSQDTHVEDITSPTQQFSQPPWSPTQAQHAPQHAQQFSYLPPIPSSSPLYQQSALSYSSFNNRPLSVTSTGPQIVPVHSRMHSALPPLPAVTPRPASSHGTGYSYAPASAYGHPGYNQPQHTEPRKSLLSIADPYLHARSRSGMETPDVDDYDYDKYNFRHSRFSSADPDAVLDEKHGFDMGEFQSPEAENFQTPEADTLHYGPAPTGKQLRRRKTKKKIPLTQGHLILDLPVPTRLVLPWKGLEEMKKTRYTAVTCDPDEFMEKRFSLRQVEHGRQTELFIVITMYNEDEILFCRTLYGVMKNIAHLQARKSSKVWGPDSWKKVVVCIVADGRRSVHPRVLDCLTALGVYQGEHMKNMVNGMPVQAHMFEYTCGFGIDPDLHFKYPDKGIVPTQIIFLMKEHNQRKINSHRWFFNAFGPVLQPNICVLLDVGTRPGPNSLYHLWKAFDRNSNVGGACGEIAVYKGPWWMYLLNPLVAAQNFEYKMSNVLDKPNESMFGYISVLPGAFSAYRYIALQNDKTTGRGPLASYFKGEVLTGRETDIFTSNMYLAEDRILSFELVAKENSDWILKYVKASVGETDVPDTLDELIMQRRRWLNGSFFAAVYSIAHVHLLLTSGHSFWRKVWLFIESVYNFINLVFAWFAIGNYCLFFVILTSSIEDPVFKLPHTTIHFANLASHYLLATIVMACFLFSMGNRPKASPWKYNTATGILAILTGYMVACGVMCAVRATMQIHTSMLYRNMVFSLIVTYGSWLAASLLALDPWHLITCMGQYTLLSPLYLVVLNIYAFANLDDITWGTKGSDIILPSDLGNVVQDSQNRVDLEISPEVPNDIYVEALENIRTKKPLPRLRAPTESEKDQMRRDYYANLRTNLLLAWALSNGLLVVCILSGVSAKDTFNNTEAGQKTRAYMTFVLAFVAITSIIRFLGSTIFTIMMAVTG